MPSANTEAMQHHLDEIARSLAPKAHAVVVLDQAGWHPTGHLRLPENLSLLPLPPKSPELNPVENVWQFLRQNKFSNRIFGSYEAIVAAACDREQPSRRSGPRHLDRNPPMGNHRSQFRAVAISPMDIKSWARSDDYTRARDRMFEATDTTHAPWYIIRSRRQERRRGSTAFRIC